MSIAITIIGHNEIDHLRELAPTLSWADEIVYVDCESTDGSFEFMRTQDCKAWRRPNDHNLNVNKSFAIGKATADWIFYLDPDERIPDELAAELVEKSTGAGPHAAYELGRRNHFFRRWLRHGSQYPDRQLRFFRRGAASFPNRHVHERLSVNGSVGRLRNDFLHFPYETVSQYVRKMDFYTGFEARFASDRPVNALQSVRYLLIKPVTRFIRRYIFKGGFLDGMPGLFACLFDSVSIVLGYFKRWEMRNT